MSALTAQRRVPAEWLYVLVTVGTFVYSPELRRLVNWRSNIDPINAFAVLPLVMLCPIALFAYRRRDALVLTGPFGAASFMWLAGFLYAAFVALAHGAIMQATYALATFCLPLSVGFWLLSLGQPMDQVHSRLARCLLLLGGTAAAYGIIQYVLAPPWDTAWMQSINNDSFGAPVPFAIRVFSVLNGPGVFAFFLGAAIIINLPYFRVSNPIQMIALLLMIVALMLTLVRSAWIAVLIAMAVYIALSPNRVRALLSLVSIAAICAIGVAGLTLASPSASDQIAQRFSTFGNIEGDSSGQDRSETSQAVLNVAIDNPYGAGLGLTGGSEKLGDEDAKILSGKPDVNIDNGFVSRFFEMGVVGFAAFALSCLISVIYSWRAYLGFRRLRNASATMIAANCVALQVVIILLNVSGDDQQGLLGVIFFSSLAMPFMRQEIIAAPARLPLVAQGVSS